MTNKRFFQFFPMLAAFSVMACLPYAPQTSTPSNRTGTAGWELLGTRKVNYSLDHDELVVTKKEGAFTALKLKVKSSPLNMRKIIVRYGNGQTQDIETKFNIPMGGESRVIDLPGNTRVIQTIDLWYDTKNVAGRKATIEVWGRH